MAGIRRASRVLGVAALAVLAAEVLALAWLVAAVPRTDVSVDLTRPLAPQLEEIDRAVIQRLPPLTVAFAKGPLATYHDHRAALLESAVATPPSATTIRHAQELSAALVRVQPRALGAAGLLLTASLVGGLGLVSSLFRRPSVASLLAPLGCCLAVTPVVTEPVAGVDYGSSLVPFASPLLVGGAAVLLTNLTVLREPVMRMGGLFARHPRLVAILCAAGLGGLAAVILALDVDARPRFFASIGAVLVANALVLLASTLITASRK